MLKFISLIASLEFKEPLPIWLISRSKARFWLVKKGFVSPNIQGPFCYEFSFWAVHKVRQHFWGGEGYLECWRLLTWGRGVFEMLTSAFLILKNNEKLRLNTASDVQFDEILLYFFLFCAIKQCNHVNWLFHMIEKTSSECVFAPCCKRIVS